MNNSRLVPAPRDRVWQALNDPETLQACIPGCESFETEADGYRATVAAKVGPVSARFAGRVQLLDVDAPNGYTLKFQGQGGVAGFANGEARVSLVPVESNATTLAYAVKAQVGGKLAQIGSRLIDAAAAKLAEDFFSRFVERVAVPAAKEGVAVVAPTTTLAKAPSSSQWVRVLAIGIIVAIVVYLFVRTR
ncbi:MAG TPA: carbon monoxide dehydrogenase subunit G [Casimicrobiaceae bacterium]|nr:carbon monoxide dehydrogenase subunit G [Casimicrobiaceae bacterium]